MTYNHSIIAFYAGFITLTIIIPSAIWSGIIALGIIAYLTTTLLGIGVMYIFFCMVFNIPMDEAIPIHKLSSE